MSIQISEPRYSKEMQDRARAKDGCMFTMNLNRKFTKCGNAGSSTTCKGVVNIDSENYKYLHLAMMLVNGLDLKDAMEHVGLPPQPNPQEGPCKR